MKARKKLARQALSGRPSKPEPKKSTSSAKEKKPAPLRRPEPLPRIPFLSGFGVFLTVFYIYFVTAYPSISGGDAGELIVTACNLGTAHPPGYPTFSMLGHLFIRLLPWGQKAWRVNIMSSFFGAIAAWLIYLAVARIASSMAAALLSSSSPAEARSRHFLLTVGPGVMAALGFALSPTVWLYAIQGEVFGLNNMLVAGMCYLTVRYFQQDTYERQVQAWLASGHKMDEDEEEAVAVTEIEGQMEEKVKVEESEKPKEKERARKKNKEAFTAAAEPASTSHSTSSSSAASSIPSSSSASTPSSAALRIAYVGAFVCGLAMTNQHTTIFYGAAIVLTVVASLFERQQLTGPVIRNLFVALFLGMAPYIYLPISAHFKVMDSWGDQRTLSGFFIHLFRREYGTFQLAADYTSQNPGMLARITVYWQTLLVESLYITPLLSVIGMWAMWSSQSVSVKRLNHALLGGYFSYIVVFHKLANLSLEPLYVGVQARFWQQANMYLFVWAAIGVFYLLRVCVHKVVPVSLSKLLLLAACFSFAAVQCRNNFPIYDNHDNYSFYNAGLHTLNAFPPNSTVLLNGDLNNNMMKYPQQCEGVRKDLNLVSVQLMTWKWFVPMQAQNYPGVTFPGNRYHPYIKGGFSLKQFLDKNYYKNPIFLCGPFKEGDASHQDFYVEVPFGLCSRLVRYVRPHVLDPSVDRYALLNASWAALAPPEALGTWRPEAYTPETWEHVLFYDHWRRQTYLSSYISFEANKQREDVRFLELAKQIVDRVFDKDLYEEAVEEVEDPDLDLEFMEPEEDDDADHVMFEYPARSPWYVGEDFLVARRLMSAHDYRSAGVILGQWSKAAEDRIHDLTHQLDLLNKPKLKLKASPSPPPQYQGLTEAQVEALTQRQRRDLSVTLTALRHQQRDAERRMLRLWAQALAMKPDDPEIKTHVQAKFNPYLGRQVTA